MARRIHAFQIFYNDATKASLDPDFEPLDNSANERPDWYEYWPMRSYFSANALDESAYYGFFSPLFFRKTQLSGKQVMAFASQAGEVDAITFSPHPCHRDRKSTRLNSSHITISYAVFCLKKK